MFSNDQFSPPPLQTLGRYHLLRRIGAGGMGDVWLANDPNLKRQVALKTLPVHAQTDHAYMARFEHEAQAVAVLNHPHILPVHDFGRQALPENQMLAYLVMPYISDGSLADRLKPFTASHTLLPTHEALHYLLQAADAIDYAHKHDIIHCDIKPANMLLRDGNWLLLADFGIARILTSPSETTLNSSGAGTPQYMAPEQARGKAEASSDLYSLAVVAYQLFTGHLPFDGETSYATIIQHMTQTPPSPRSYNSALSPDFETALLQGLLKDPAQRPTSSRAFVTSLQQTLLQAPFATTLLPESPLHPTAPALPALPPTLPAPKKHTLPRRQLLVAGTTAAALALAGGSLATWLVLNSHTQDPTPHPSTITTPAPGSETSPLVLTGHNQPVDALSWSPKEWLLASAGSTSDQQVFLWDIQQILANQQSGGTPTYRSRQQFPQSNGLFLSWSPDGNALAIAKTSLDGPGLDIKRQYITVYQPDLQTFAPGYDQTFGDNGMIVGITWIKENYLLTFVYSGSLVSNPTNEQDFLHVWKFGSTHQPFASIPFALNQVHDGLDTLGAAIINQSCIFAFPNTQMLAINTNNGVAIGTITLSSTTASWQQQTLLPLSADPTGSSTSISTITGTYDAHSVSSLPKYTTRNVDDSDPNIPPLERKIDSSQCIELWTLSSSTAKTILNVQQSTIPTISTIALSPKPGDTLLAAGTSEGTIYLWDITRSTIQIKTLKGLPAPVCRVSWSADGAWLAASYTDAQSSILLWRRDEVLRG